VQILCGSNLSNKLITWMWWSSAALPTVEEIGIPKKASFNERKHM